MTANRCLAASRNSRAAILYWYQLPRRTVASEWLAKAFAVVDAVRDHRTDIAMVRVAAGAQAGREATAASAAVSFVRAYYPEVRRVLTARR